MDNDREQILAQLYGIRAGMSVISQEADKIRKEQAKFTATKSKLIDEKQKELTEAIAIKNNATTTKYYASCTYSIRPYILKSLLFLILFLISATITYFVASWGIPNCFSTDGKTASWGEILNILVIKLLGLVGSIALIFLSLGILYWVFKPFEDIKNITPSQWQIKEAKERLAQLDKNIETLHSEINTGKKHCETEQKKLQSFLIEQTNNCTIIHSALKRQYGKFLDPRDWQHVDLLIFYFETGRVETLKEALLYVDKQVQTDTIVHAIQTATAEINRTINQNTYKLAQIIGSGISLLSSQVGQVLQAQNIQITQLEKLTAQTSQLVSSQNMMQALQEKSSTPSPQMAEDMHYVRTIIENGEIRRRNNP